MLTDAEIKLCVDALWDNLQDGWWVADRLYSGDMDRAAEDLERSFRDFLAKQPDRARIR